MQKQTAQNGGRSKNENLGPWTKLNQILYTYSVGTQKIQNAKTNYPKWLRGEPKNENLGPWTKLNQILYSLSVGPQKTKNALEFSIFST